jgi:hypothetical protein
MASFSICRASDLRPIAGLLTSGPSFHEPRRNAIRISANAQSPPLRDDAAAPYKYFVRRQIILLRLRPAERTIRGIKAAASQDWQAVSLMPGAPKAF